MHSFVGNNFIKNIQVEPFIATNCTYHIHKQSRGKQDEKWRGSAVDFLSVSLVRVYRKHLLKWQSTQEKLEASWFTRPFILSLFSHRSLRNMAVGYVVWGTLYQQGNII